MLVMLLGSDGRTDETIAEFRGGGRGRREGGGGGGVPIVGVRKIELLLLVLKKDSGGGAGRVKRSTIFDFLVPLVEQEGVGEGELDGRL